MLPFLDRWNKKDVTPICHDENDLTGITPLIGMNQDVLEPTILYRQNDLLERDAAPGF